MRRRLLLAVALVAVPLAVARAQDLGILGKALTEGAEAVLRDLQTAAPNLTEPQRLYLAEQGAPVLEAWLAWSRGRVRAAGVQPIPPEIRAKLSGFFADVLLDAASYRVGGVDTFDLAAGAIRFADATAVTLGDVIVFADEASAADPVLWAHELAHVQQVREWGLTGFAEQYLFDWHAVERGAYAVEARYELWAKENGVSLPPRPRRPDGG